MPKFGRVYLALPAYTTESRNVFWANQLEFWPSEPLGLEACRAGTRQVEADGQMLGPWKRDDGTGVARRPLPSATSAES